MISAAELWTSLHASSRDVLEDPASHRRIPTPMSPADYAKLIVAETDKRGAVIKAANIKLE